MTAVALDTPLPSVWPLLVMLLVLSGAAPHAAASDRTARVGPAILMQSDEDPELCASEDPPARRHASNSIFLGELGFGGHVIGDRGCHGDREWSGMNVAAFTPWTATYVWWYEEDGSCWAAGGGFTRGTLLPRAEEWAATDVPCEAGPPPAPWGRLLP